MADHVPIPRLTSLQAARGGAALAVVLSHAAIILGSHLPAQPLGGVLRAGHAGVDFFFVLSGFIIATAHLGDVGQPGALGAYLWRRATRIYPIYWVASLAALIVAERAPGTDRVLTSLLLVPQHVEPILGVAWTLQHEALFYLTFGMLILNRAAGVTVFAAWFVFAGALAPWGRTALPWENPDLLRCFVGSSYNLEFCLGLAVAGLVRGGKVRAPHLLTALGVVGLLATAAAEDAGLLRYLGEGGQLLFGTSAALLIAGLATLERAGLIRAPGRPAFLGDASYAIYLAHVPMMVVVAPMLVVMRLPAWLGVLVLFGLGTAAGVALHLGVERPALRWLRNVSGPLKRAKCAA